MYFVIRIVFLVLVSMAAATVASSKVATLTAQHAMSQNMQGFLTGLAGIIAAVLVGGAAFLLLYLSANRE